MEPPQWECIAAVLPNNQLMVVGGSRVSFRIFVKGGGGQMRQFQD